MIHRKTLAMKKIMKSQMNILAMKSKETGSNENLKII